MSEETLSARAHEAGPFAVEQRFRQDDEGCRRPAPVGEETGPRKTDFSETNEK